MLRADTARAAHCEFLNASWVANFSLECRYIFISSVSEYGTPSKVRFQHLSLRTLLWVGRDGGAHAVGADALNGSGHRKLLQAAFEVAMLSLQLLLHV